MSAKTFPEVMVGLETAEIIASCRFVGDGIHLVLRVPMRSGCCGMEHAWFVNRDGRTRCWDCDEKYLAERAAAWGGP